MPVIGCGLNDHVDVVAFHDLAEIVELSRHLASYRELLRRRIRMALVHIAHANDFAESTRVFRVTPAHSPAPNQSDTGAVIWAEPLRTRFFRARQLALNKPQRQTSSSARGGTTSKI